jgi:hypothetical protein
MFELLLTCHKFHECQICTFGEGLRFFSMDLPTVAAQECRRSVSNGRIPDL